MARHLALIVGAIAFCFVPRAHARPERCDAGQETYRTVSKHNNVFDRLPKQIPTSEVVDGSILGNGDTGVAIAGSPAAQRLSMAKCDSWKVRTVKQQGVCTKVVDGLAISMPLLEGASYHAEQALYERRRPSIFRTGDDSVEMRPWVSATEDPRVITLTWADQEAGVAVKPWVQSGDGSTMACITSMRLQLAKCYGKATRGAAFLPRVAEGDGRVAREATNLRCE